MVNPYSSPQEDVDTVRAEATKSRSKWPIWGAKWMTLRIFTTVFVILIVFPVCYGAWFWVFNLVPPEFGMPAYEEAIELVFLVGSVAFSVIPLFISIRVCGFLNRRLLFRRLGCDDRLFD